MKKIIGMVLALAMVLSLATVVFAAGTQSDPEAFGNSDMVPNKILEQTLDAGAKYYYSYTAEAAGTLTVSVVGGSCVVKCGSTSVTLSSDSSMGDIDVKANDVVSIELINNGSASATISATVSFAAAGSMDNPEVIRKMGSVKITLDSREHFEHYYSWTASKAGTLKISVSASTDWQFFANVKSGDDEKNGDWHTFDTDSVTTEEIEVNAGDIVTISLTNMSYTKNNNFTLSLVFTDTDGNVDDGSNPGTGDGIAVALAAMMVSGTAIVLSLKKKEN